MSGSSFPENTANRTWFGFILLALVSLTIFVVAIGFDRHTWSSLSCWHIHITAFCAWTLAWLLFCHQFRGRRNIPLLWSVNFPIGFATFSEIIQVIIPHHDPSLAGMIASNFGVLSGLALWGTFIRCNVKRSRVRA